MSELAWASEMLRGEVSPVGSAQSVETRIRDAARRLGWKFSRVRDVWYGDDRVSLKPRELREIEQITGLRYGHEALRDVDATIAKADALLMGADPNLVRAIVAALRAVAGDTDRSGAGR